MLDNLTDDRLVGEALSGVRQAAEVLVGRYLGRVYGLALRILSNSHDAEDATQEALLRAMQSLGSYRSSGTFDRWILKIASNTCMDRLRQRKTFRVVADSEAPAREPGDGEKETSAATTQPTAGK